MDARLIEQAKEQARLSGKSLSQLVADYFVQLGEAPLQQPLPPVVRALKGALKGRQDMPDEQDYRRHAECQCIVTRKVRDFAAASMPVYTPAEFLLVRQKTQGRH
ncbi:DUF6364 family protein [Thauera sp. Sel9]|nr:DUF6364 family protein [Thauera sp. Sel9]